VHPAIELEKSLQLATIPLEVIQPSIVALVRAYISSFPKILEDRPDFLNRVVQFAGLALIYQILAKIQYQRILIIRYLHASSSQKPAVPTRKIIYICFWSNRISAY
jgi:hypothetical protein